MAIDPEMKAAFDALATKIDAAYQAAEKTRAYIWWTMVITLAVIVIPLLLLPFVLPSLVSTYSSALNI